jgi:probable rRNA maturation factor
VDIQIANRQRRRRISRRAIGRTARIALTALKRPDSELSIVLVDDARIAELNRSFLEREGATNVIAFPMREGAFTVITPRLLGDVVISVETAWRESREAGLTLQERLDALLIHGILHLCGYDHENDPAAARRMSARARRLLARVRESRRKESPCTS